ncbi:Pup--protein ligase [Demequina sp. TTPB684]|uniref:Pup--protein ligase n=1 Tax=unclassified Demequina TaxID=2620311 RepID=UPI001CF5C0F1|nr:MULTISPECIES: Pup--protein ligase [unclassified Demequina]MCB2413926.1 Pup--protein ligase [Demequina sp. TTPB684]UPU89386.1 Pup--protein ligase [Demequina sp. TMPB413]
MMLGEVPPAQEVDSARRIMGLETEFGLHFDAPQSRSVTPEEVAGHLFHSVVEWGRSSNVFLTNGSRLYIDVGAHPEYATAECDSLRDIVAYDKAGERIVHDLVAKGESRLAAAGLEGSIYLYKNNTDSAGNSYGCHENYLVRRRADFKAFASVLLPFFVSRQIVTGSGCITRTPQGAHYSFSPRADHMWEGMSSATTRSRPMINTRDEPHAHADLYRRMHVIVGDSTMAEPTTRLKMGSTDLLLRILEARLALPELALANEMQAIRTIAHDVTGAATVELADGRHMTGADLQEACLVAVRERLDDVIERTEETEQVLDLWERGIAAVRSRDTSGVETELEWAVKFRLLERYRERLGCALDDPRLARLEMAFHDVSPTRGLFNRLQADGLVSRIVDEADIVHATTQPPATTRAALRGRFVREALAAGSDYTVDWVHLKLSGPEPRTVLLKDPFRNLDERVDVLLASLNG